MYVKKNVCMLFTQLIVNESKSRPIITQPTYTRWFATISERFK